jgi:hypothetical protein
MDLMRSGFQIFAAASALLTCSVAVAQAQTRTAYQVGINVAQKRGYSNTDCYAKVFAKHAVAVVYSNGSRGWSAASTPAYNNELRQRCGVDRLGDMAAKRQQAPRMAGTPPQAPLLSRGPVEAPQTRSGAYATGLAIARQRGHSGEKANCYARVFVTHAYYRPNPNRVGVVGWAATIGPAYQGEMFSQCGISS